MAVKQIEWKPEVNRDTGKRWLRVLISGVLCALLVFGCFSLALTVLGMREVEGEFKFRFFVWAGSLGFCFLQEWTEYEESINKSRLRSILPAIGLLVGQLIVIWFLYSAGGDIWSDLQTLGETYLHRISIQDPDYRMSRAGTNAIKPALEFGILVLFAFFQAFSCALRKQKVLLAMPVFVVCAGLLTMAVPQWKDLALVFLSGMMLVYLENCIRISWKRFGILLAVLLILVSVAGSYEADARDEMLAMNEDWFAYWNDFGETIGEKLENLEMPQFNADKDVIDNKAPEFAEKPVLVITMDEKPAGTLYLRGYHCTDYEDSEWKKDATSFAKACREYGIEEEDATERLMENQYEQEEKAGGVSLDFEISYTKYCDEYAYLPYGAGWEELPKGYELTGDYVVTGKHTEELSVTGWQSLSYVKSLEAPQDYSRFKDWYNDYVYENYLEVSGDLDAVEDLAEELREDAVFSSYLTYITVENHTPDTINYYRLQLAQGVAQYLKRKGTYSLELDKLPSGEDAVEYFLENDMEGFCEHFASAGTLLLRELGVPARYVGGYIVKQGDIVKEDDGYEATVMDSAAHAWTEIYLENYGWVPIEMTPGYGGTDSIAEPEITPEPEDAEPTEEPATAPDEEPTATPAGEPDLAPEEPTAVPGEDAETSGEEMEDGENEDSEDAEDSDDSHKNSGRDGSVWGKVLSGFLIVAVLAGAVAVISRYLRGRKARGMKRLLGYMQRGENRNAVRWINKLMYEQLVEKEKKRNKYSDAEYLGALKCLYPEIEEARWDSYFEVVRKAVYSKERISSEDVKVCYEVYKEVLSTDIKER